MATSFNSQLPPTLFPDSDLRSTPYHETSIAPIKPEQLFTPSVLSQLPKNGEIYPIQQGLGVAHETGEDYEAYRVYLDQGKGQGEDNGLNTISFFVGSDGKINQMAGLNGGVSQEIVQQLVTAKVFQSNALRTLGLAPRAPL
jgi:hypothetical protein